MKIAFDLDDTITLAPEFFSTLSKLWDDDVYIITLRSDRQETIEDLEKLDIRYTDVILVSTCEEKADVVKRLGISVYFDDMPETLVNMPETTAVCLFRNTWNFDFEDRRWIFTDATGKITQ